MGLGEFNGGGIVNKFIVIEGLDATGKSTLVEKLSNKLNAKIIMSTRDYDTINH